MRPDACHLPTLLAALPLFLRADSVPADLDLASFSGPDLTPSPACLCVSAAGEVYVGVDMNGFPGKGKIVKLVDRDHDAKAEEQTEFAKIDNPAASSRSAQNSTCRTPPTVDLAKIAAQKGRA